MISFNYQNTKYRVKKINDKKKWLNHLAHNEGFKIIELNYILVNDDELLEMNRNYLKHDTLTDIITFDNSEGEKKIEGDIFISIDRVKENAKKFDVETENELVRVLAHGLLHLCGYKDKNATDKKQMRSKEDYYIELYFNKN